MCSKVEKITFAIGRICDKIDNNWVKFMPSLPTQIKIMVFR